MKLKIALLLAAGLSSLTLPDKAIASPIQDSCTYVTDIQLRTACVKTKTQILQVQLEYEKDKGCLMQRQSLKWGYSKFPISPECQERLAAWDEKHPEDRARELKLLEP